MNIYLIFTIVLGWLTLHTTAFIAGHHSLPTFIVDRPLSSLHATSPTITEARRKELLKRDGPFFQIDRSKQTIEFGSSTTLVTQLEDDDANAEGIEDWLRDGRSLALSIWEDIEELSPDTYRLRIMKLQFVTLQLQPLVDVQMKTVTAQSLKSGRTFPLFRLQSIGFDPQLQILPGMSMSAESLGIVIQVVGDLRPTSNGVKGKVSFATTGSLPPALAILPEPALRAAANTINSSITDFASQSFQKGARAKYQEYMKNSQKQMQQ